MKKLLPVFLLSIMMIVIGIPFEANAVPQNIIPIHWADLMSRMDWQADSYSYSVGEGEQKVNVSRVGDHTLITGGHICNVRMSRKDLWYEEDMALYGWHTASGTYTFSDVVFHGQNTLLEVWANDNDKFCVVLEENVKGARVLEGFVAAGPSIHVSKIPIYYQTMSQLGYRFEEIEGGFGIDVQALKESSVEIVNNTLIDTYSWNWPLGVNLDSSASFALSGEGEIRLSPAMTRDLEVNRQFHMLLSICGRANSDQTVVEQYVDLLCNRVQIDETQFTGASGRPQIYCSYNRIGSDDPFMGVEMSFDRISVRSPLTVNAANLQLQTNDPLASVMETQSYLLNNHEMLFHANLLNENEEPWRLQDKAGLYIPYPAEVDAENAKNYLFSTDYPNPTGSSPKHYSTEDGTITPTEHGLLIHVDDVYPFKLRWERNSEQSGIHNRQDAEELPPVETPILILPDGVELDLSARLVFDLPNADHNGRIIYNVRLINAGGSDIELPSEAILCFPYPKGMDQSSARKYSILIHHYGKDGTEVFKSEDGRIELTKQGLCIRVRSLSPFVISWKEKDDMAVLPRTGDNSNVILWFVLMLMSGTVIWLNKGGRTKK